MCIFHFSNYSETISSWKPEIIGNTIYMPPTPNHTPVSDLLLSHCWAMSFLFQLSDVLSVNWTNYLAAQLCWHGIWQNNITQMTRDKFSNLGGPILPLLIMNRKVRNPSVGLGQLTEELADDRHWTLEAQTCYQDFFPWQESSCFSSFVLMSNPGSFL